MVWLASDWKAMVQCSMLNAICRPYWVTSCCFWTWYFTLMVWTYRLHTSICQTVQLFRIKHINRRQHDLAVPCVSFLRIAHVDPLSHQHFWKRLQSPQHPNDRPHTRACSSRAQLGGASPGSAHSSSHPITVEQTATDWLIAQSCCLRAHLDSAHCKSVGRSTEVTWLRWPTDKDRLLGR